MRRRTFLAASAATLAMPAIGRGADAKVLKFIPQADLAAIDPVWTTAYVTRNHGYMVFDTLYGQQGPENEFKAAPQMVAGHTMEEGGKTWKLTLRDGLVFHDGQKVLARDCVASVQRWGARDAFGQAVMQRTDEISAPDDKTIVFRMKKPFSMLPDALGKSASNMCAMMPERLAKTDPFKQVTELVGSGPYKFKQDERVQGSRYVYERFDGYKPREDGKPDWTSGPKIVHFDRVEWHIIPDPGTAAAALQSGEIDWWEIPTSDLLPLLQQNKHVKVENIDPTGLCGILRPNHLYPPFNDAAVRQALWSAIDQTEFMVATVGTDESLRKVPCGFFAPSSPLASDAGMTALTSKRDNAKAKQALRAAGYKDGKVALMVSTDFPTLKAMDDVAADMLKKVGMNLDYQAVDWGTVVQRRALKSPPDKGGWNMFVTSFAGLDFFSPATHLPLRGNGGQAWFGWPTNPKIEDLRNQWFDAPDLAAQKKIAAEIQQQAFLDVPYYPLGSYFTPTAYRSDLTGIVQGIPTFWNVRRS